MTFVVLRLNSLGNIAMSAPMIWSASKLNAHHRFVVVTERDISCFFHGLDNVECISVAMPSSLLANVRTLFFLLLSYRPHAILDLQGNALTGFLRFLFLLRGVRSYGISMDWFAKMRLCLLGYRHSTPIRTEFTRYKEVFLRAGLQIDDSFISLEHNSDAAKIVDTEMGNKNKIWIGIAPFAKYTSNQLPHKIMKEVVAHLSSDDRIRVFLFGGGKVECEVLKEWASLYKNVVSVAYRFPLSVELEFMRKIDLMVCMDSANQHLAKLVSARVLTIWCATHDFAGFACWKQKREDWIYGQDLVCRPCTINGKSTCRFNNFSCKIINSKDILDKIYSSLNLQINF